MEQENQMFQLHQEQDETKYHQAEYHQVLVATAKLVQGALELWPKRHWH